MEKKTRSEYFTPIELEVLMTSYDDYKSVFVKKSNTKVAAKEREAAWGKIADRVNA